MDNEHMVIEDEHYEDNNAHPQSPYAHYPYYGQHYGHHPHYPPPPHYGQTPPGYNGQYPPDHGYHHHTQHPLVDNNGHSGSNSNTTPKNQPKSNKNSSSDDDPLLTYLGAFEPKISPLTPEQENKLKKNILNSPEIDDGKMPKKLSLPREQRSSPPDFLYPQNVHKNKANGDRHAFASAFTDKYPPPNPVQNAQSNPTQNVQSVQSPSSPETPETKNKILRNNKTLRPLIDSYSYNVFSRGNDDQKKPEKETKPKPKQKGKSKPKNKNEAGKKKNNKKKNKKNKRKKKGKPKKGDISGT